MFQIGDWRVLIAYLAFSPICCAKPTSRFAAENLMSPHVRVDRAVNEQHLPVASGLLEDHRIGASYLVSAFIEHVIESGPASVVRVSNLEVCDAELLCRPCR